MTDTIKAKYAAVAASTLSSKHAGVQAVAEAFGYTAGQLASIPAEANMGLSCGNPTATAALRPGEVVVDLGCGGGLDVFLAAAKVGPVGKAIGIDMTPEMIARAKANAAQGVAGRPFTNVEFHLATIDRMPLADASVDCVISNCVINLAPDKSAVFREVLRILKPGGRLAASDIALKRPLPAELADDITAYVGCIAGAVLIDDYVRMLKTAGFADVAVVDTKKDLHAYAKVENQSACCAPAMETVPLTVELLQKPCCPPAPQPQKTGCCSSGIPTTDALHARLADLLRRYNVNDYAASVQVYAIKAR